MSLTPQLVLFEEDHKKIVAVAERLVSEANAKAIFLVDKNGQLIADAGELKGIDTTSLASLVAGNIAATGGLAKILGEEEFPIHFHQGLRHDRKGKTNDVDAIVEQAICHGRCEIGVAEHDRNNRMFTGLQLETKARHLFTKIAGILK